MTTTSIRPDHHDQAATPVVAFLGTGRMGTPMAANLARAGQLTNLASGRSRSGTPLRTPNSPRRPRRPAAPRSPSPARCFRAGGTPRPAATPTTTCPPST
jgi:hypothetical protein